MARRRAIPIALQDIGTMVDVFAGLRAEYSAGKTSRFRRTLTGVSSMGSSADYHYRNEVQFLRMIETARRFDRDDCIVGQGVSRLIQNVLQDGITVDPQTGDPKLDQDLAPRYNAWADDPDATHAGGELTLHEMGKLTLRSVITDGDIVHLPHTAQADGTLEPVEAHRLRNSRSSRRANLIHGVLINEFRKPLEYWLCKDDLDPNAPAPYLRDMKRYKARDARGRKQVLHIYNPKRFSQSRGVTACAPIVDMVGMHDDVQFAQLVKQQVASCFAIFRERDIDDQGPGTAQEGARETDTMSDGVTRTLEGIAPGMDITGAPGEKLEGFSPNIPNPEFFRHAMLVLNIIAVNLGLPVAVLLLDPSQTNFSGWRGAMDQARMGFRDIQDWMVRRFYRPVYLWKLRHFIAADGVLRRAAERDGTNIFGHRFNCPSWPYIEPLKDATTDLVRTRNALISHSRRARERGMDWEDLSTEIVEDNAKLIVKAKLKADELNKTHEGLNITWREVAALPLPEGMKIVVSTGGQDDGEKDKDDA